MTVDAPYRTPTGAVLRWCRRVAVLAAGLALAGCLPAVQSMGPAVQEPLLNEDSFVARDGTALPMRAWVPDGQPSAVILALHGFNDYGNGFAEPGRYWAERGIATYAFDQRGFGAGVRPGIWPGAETMIADIRSVAAALRERHPGLPLFLLGESMGGAAAMVAMASPAPPDVDGLILSAPAVWARETMNPLYRGTLWLASRTVPWLTVTARGLDITPSDNIDMLIALGQDPLVIKETRVDAIHGLVDLMDAALAVAPEITAPTLVLYGRNDEIIPKEPTGLMLSRLTAPGRVALYPDGYHMLLRDLRAQVVLDDVAAWIADPAAPLPSGHDRGWQSFFTD